MDPYTKNSLQHSYSEMKNFIKIATKPLIAVLIIACLPFTNALANDLNSLYKLARENDPTIQAAKEVELVALESLPQARAKLLPIVSASAGSTYHNSTNPLLLRYNSKTMGITLSQPIINLTNWREYQRIDDKIKSALAVYASADQELIIRVAKQYFDILKGQDDLSFAKAERTAFSHHLEQTQQRFQVGLIAITDVHEAQARHDNAYAQEITAENALQNQKEKMREIVKEKVSNIHMLQTNIGLSRPDPNDIEHWVNAALNQNLELQAKRYDLSYAKKNISLQRAGHYPTLSLDSNVTHAKTSPPAQTTATAREIGLTISMPIFSGGTVTSKTREASYNYEFISKQTEELQREIESETRQAYRGILSKISQITALQQAVISTSSALEATQAAFEVGTRTIVDVLNAQSDLLNAKRNFAKARYDYILESLNLKKFAGILNEKDVESINEDLQPTKL